MFVANCVAGVLNTRLPKFDLPKCETPNCGSHLLEPRPFHTEETDTRGLLKVHCLARCPICAAEYKGERMIRVGRRTEAVSQSFHRYNDEDRALVTTLLPQFKQNAGKLQQIQAMPVKD